MNHEQVGRLWNANAEDWTKLARAGYDIDRDYLNSPAFFERLPDVAASAGSTSVAAKAMTRGSWRDSGSALR